MTPDDAKRRFQTVATLRLGGLVLCLLGMLIWRTDAIGPRDEVVGRLTLALGIFFLFPIPALLIRRWRKRG